MNLVVGGANDSDDGENTWDSPPTPQNQNTKAETSGLIGVICRWKAASYDGETSQWVNDYSIPTDKLLRLTVESTVNAFGSVGTQYNQGPPSGGAVTVNVVGLGANSDTQGGEEHRQTTSSEHSLWKSKSQTKRKVYILPVPEPTTGEYKVEFVLDGISSKSHIVTGSQGGGFAGVSAYYNIKSVVPYDLCISSFIDQSYRKTTTQPAAPPGEAAPPPIVGTHPPAWRVPVAPGGTRESVASVSDAVSPANSPVQNPPPAPVPYWVGSTTYDSNPRGLIQPDFKWDFGLPTYGNHAAASFKSQSASPMFLLAPASNDTGFPLSSTITVEVVDMDPGSPSNKLTDSYTVNWHLPLEKTGDLPTFPRKAYERDQTLSASVSGAMGTPIHVEGYFESIPAVAYMADFVGDIGNIFNVATPQGIVDYIKRIDNVLHDPYQFNLTEQSASGANAWVVAQHLDANSDFSPPYGLDDQVMPPRIPADLSNASQGWADCDFQYYLVKYWKVNRWYGDVYGTHGYDGQCIANSRECKAYEAQPWFTRHQSPWGGGQ